MKTTCTWK